MHKTNLLEELNLSVFRYFFKTLYYNFMIIVHRCRNHGKKVRIGHGCQISSNSSFEGFNYIERMTRFNRQIGYASYIGSGSVATKYVSPVNDS